MINSSRVLVLAMLSTASGWGLPSHDPLLSSNESTNITDGVDDERDRRQLGGPADYAYGCSCDWSCDVACDGRLSTKCDGSCDRGCDDKYGENDCDEGKPGGGGPPKRGKG